MYKYKNVQMYKIYNIHKIYKFIIYKFINVYTKYICANSQNTQMYKI